MSKPENITPEVMNVAVSIEGDIPSRVTGANRVFIRAVIARAIMTAKAEEREACAQVAEAMRTPYHGSSRGIANEQSSAIAAAIRKRGEG